jgi:hypothetical protein
MTTEEIFPTLNELRGALATHGYQIDSVGGPVSNHWNKDYHGCMGHFTVEKVVEEEHVARVLDSWIVVVDPDGTILSQLPEPIASIVRVWVAGFAQAG